MYERNIEIKNGDSFLVIPATLDDLREIRITLYTAPVSLQSKGKQKRTFKEFVRKLTRQVDVIIAGDVGIEVSWYTHEQLRFEAPNFLDVDNISKVIIDAISGPEGVIVDDCVVQHQSCTWIDTCGREYIEITISYNDTNCFQKNNLCFLHLGKNLYHIAATDCPKVFLDTLVKMFQRREKILEDTGDYFATFGSMTIQRLFVRNKLRNFKLLNYEDFPSVKN
ncbi:MAG: hypothetical protein MUO63_12955 [Desulfobulbaceae bacterium]|nr:hypothetical protein [Desulfobulbaceae bacterium]